MYILYAASFHYKSAKNSSLYVRTWLRIGQITSHKMLAKITCTNSVDYLGFSIILKHLSITLNKLSFVAVVNPKHDSLPSALSLSLTSGSRSWSFPCGFQEDNYVIGGEILTNELDFNLAFNLYFNNIQCPWIQMRIDLSQLNDVTKWIKYFSGYKRLMPDLNLGGLAKRILSTVEVISAGNPTSQFSAFCENVLRPDFVVHMARLSREGHFPAIFSQDNGVLLGSRLLVDWNILMIQEGEQRLFVFQGVTSCDAIFIPGLNKLIIVCHITSQNILSCLRELSLTPDFYQLDSPRSFCGYLVGHARPYHCNYDSLLGLQRIRDEGELCHEDALFSKDDEAFIDLGAGLGLTQNHQIRTKDRLNKMTETKNGYLLKIGVFFGSQPPDSYSLELANSVDTSLRQYATTSSNLSSSGALDLLEECHPLLWVGITGQKRCWIEQVEGTAAILNELHEYYPNLGVIFDGWTPPLVNGNRSDYHQKESRKDNDIIQEIIKRLPFRKQGRFGIVAGLPMLEKIRIGMSVDLYMANYTTGSINIARICQKPGVGHMSNKMVAHKFQHIHYRTKEIDIKLVKDECDPDKPTGYINYSFPWQDMYNKLLDILTELNIVPSKPITPLLVPTNHEN